MLILDTLNYSIHYTSYDKYHFRIRGFFKMELRLTPCLGKPSEYPINPNIIHLFSFLVVSNHEI